MSMGIPKDIGSVNQGDTAELYASAYVDDLAVDDTSIVSVSFVVEKPDKSRVTTTGIVQEDGQGFLRWADTTNVGRYVALAQFTLDSGEKRSTKIAFSVRDPFNDEPLEPLDQIADAVWLKLEDCFDSSEGGPWLRDQTLRFFNKEKINAFIDDALSEINTAMPVTNVDLSFFTTVGPQGQADPDQGLLVQGVLLSTIRHLMRSYVEQPSPTGANVVWYDRRDYLQRWGTIYQIEYDWFLRRLGLWKRQFLNLGQSALLVSSKAGRTGYGPGMKARNVGRGYGY